MTGFGTAKIGLIAPLRACPIRATRGTRLSTEFADDREPAAKKAWLHEGGAYRLPSRRQIMRIAIAQSACQS
jgi:hypothetical protein